jgi:hypothetical protein
MVPDLGSSLADMPGTRGTHGASESEHLRLRDRGGHLRRWLNQYTSAGLILVSASGPESTTARLLRSGAESGLCFSKCVRQQCVRVCSSICRAATPKRRGMVRGAQPPNISTLVTLGVDSERRQRPTAAGACVLLGASRPFWVPTAHAVRSRWWPGRFCAVHRNASDAMHPIVRRNRFRRYVAPSEQMRPTTAVEMSVFT